jgi:hypothetical protein
VAERKRFERSVRVVKNSLIQWWRFRDANPGPADFDVCRFNFKAPSTQFTSLMIEGNKAGIRLLERLVNLLIFQ